MSHLTSEQMMEKKSIHDFKNILYPWTVTKPEDDTGIDLYIQPLHKDGKPTNSFFKAQLKSEGKLGNCKPKESGLSVKHLEQWINSNVPVMLAKYYIEEETMYYIWINKNISIKQNQKTQTIYFSEKLTSVSKQDILNYLEPVNLYFESIDYATPNHPYITGHSNCIQVRDKEHLINDVLKEFNNFSENASKILSLQKQLQNLERRFYKTNDKKLLLLKSFILAKLGKYNDAKREICNLIQLENLPLGYVMKRLLEEKDLINALDSLKPVYYLKWEQVTPPKTDITCILTIDNKEVELKPYNPSGNVLPDGIKTLNVKFKLHSFDGSETPILNLKTIQLFITFLDDNSKPLYRLGERIRDILI